jgi:hypothetical protein
MRFLITGVGADRPAGGAPPARFRTDGAVPQAVAGPSTVRSPGQAWSCPDGVPALEVARCQVGWVGTTGAKTSIAPLLSRTFSLGSGAGEIES